MFHLACSHSFSIGRMEMEVIALILIIIAGLCNGMMDSIQFHWKKSIPAKRGWNEKFWNPKISWKNKYGDLDKLTPKFFGSTTFFVFLTDGWHLMQFFLWLSIFIAVVLFNPLLGLLLDFLTLRVLFWIGFKMTYK